LAEQHSSPKQSFKQVISVDLKLTFRRTVKELTYRETNRTCADAARGHRSQSKALASDLNREERW
jgi:hypothetical protein